MLAEIAACNAAFAVIKTALQNGKQIVDLGNQISDFVNAEESARKKAEKLKRNSGGSDLSAFIQLEKVRQQEEELKQWMIYAGRPNLYQDWMKFKANARKARLAEIERKKRKRQQIIEICGYSLLFLLFGTSAVAFVLWVMFLRGNLG